MYFYNFLHNSTDPFIKIMLNPLLRPVFFAIILLISTVGRAQLFPAKDYPRDYFAYPLEAKVGVVANFGELRPNHFHMGLDCRTEQVQNKRVLAAADGYIARIKIEPWGFGRSIYINHPNGLSTLYAHLNDFYPELETYVKQQQYALKSWAVDLDIPANKFPVTKQMFIAYSGNTGGSQGPHLHFEIRDTRTDKCINPLLFNFPISDNVAPDVYRLALYDRTISTYEQSPKIYTLKKKNGVYVTSPALIMTNTHKVSFGITSFDRFDGSGNRNGIYETILYDNENAVVGFQMDQVSYDETRYLNAHIDYSSRARGKGFIQHVSRLPGYNNSVYKTFSGDGSIDISDDSAHNIKMEVKDAHGNTSTVEFAIQRSAGAPRKTGDLSMFKDPLMFHPGYVNVFENSNILFYLPEVAMFDSVNFKFREIPAAGGFNIFELQNTTVPFFGYFPISMRASSAWPGKMVMHRFAGGKHDYAKAVPVTMDKETGWYRASFREFGSFQLMIDTIPPVITPIGFRNGMNSSKQSRIVFSVKDNTEELKFTATLDGNWLRFTNDKASRFIYNFDEMCPPGEHELKIVVEDQVGNVAERVYRFTR